MIAIMLIEDGQGFPSSPGELSGLLRFDASQWACHLAPLQGV
jgi:hypothetical protein